MQYIYQRYDTQPQDGETAAPREASAARGEAKAAGGER